VKEPLADEGVPDETDHLLEVLHLHDFHVVFVEHLECGHKLIDFAVRHPEFDVESLFNFLFGLGSKDFLLLTAAAKHPIILQPSSVYISN